MVEKEDVLGPMVEKEDVLGPMVEKEDVLWPSTCAQSPSLLLSR